MTSQLLKTVSSDHRNIIYTHIIIYIPQRTVLSFLSLCYLHQVVFVENSDIVMQNIVYMKVIKLSLLCKVTWARVYKWR